jgi:6-bladed beta-propeller protein
MRVFCLAALVTALAAACGPARPSAEGSAGLATLIDSTADTVFARVRGTVAEPAIRRLVEELRVAPGVDDTTLFTEISEFDVDPAGQLWVYDRSSNSIFLFDRTGKLLHRVGRQGAGPGEFNANSGMVALGDTGLAIWDSRNARISFFSPAGDFRTSWLTPSGFSTSNGLTTDRSGALFLRRPVTSPREGEILGRMGLVRLKPGGAFGDTLVPPDLPIPREVYVAETKGGRSSTGSQYAPNYFWAWHPEGFFVVGDGGNYEIVLARPAAKPLAIRRDLAGVPISEAERSEEQARITASMRMTDPSWSWRGPPIPSTNAPLQGIFLARDGRIWAQVAVPSERIPEAELVVPRDTRMPARHFRLPAVYEVFGADGRFLGRVNLPRRSRLMEADGNTVWVLQRDENDLPAVVRLRIEPELR